MIVTDRLVFVHMPKTGGTFVRKVLEELYGVAPAPRGRLARLLRRLRPRRRPPFHQLRKHGACREIPPEAAHLPILGCVRNPLDRYVSQYTFGWWRTHPEEFPGIAEHPSFPELTFTEFVELAMERFARHDHPRVDPSLGWHTVQLVEWYGLDPKRLLGSSAALTAERLRDGLFPVTFLHTDRLNHDLLEALLELGFPADRLAFIRELPRIYPREGGRPPTEGWEAYYTPALRRLVRHRERLLFELFPELEGGV